MNANGGGIHVGDGSDVTIDHTVFRRNQATVSDPYGEPVAFDSAVHPGDGNLVLRHSTISDNLVVALVASTADVGPSGSAMDAAGLATITDTRITDNTAEVTSRSGDAGGTGGGVYSLGTGERPVVISDSVISNNTTTASSTGGAAFVLGGGILNDGRLVLNNNEVANNLAIVRGPFGHGHGGGIWSGSIFNEGPIELTLNGTSVTGNTLRGTAGITFAGGGLFTNVPVTIRRSPIVHNVPDNCVGCPDSGSIATDQSAGARTRDWRSSRFGADQSGRSDRTLVLHR
jgi:hypothetical protein